MLFICVKRQSSKANAWVHSCLYALQTRRYNWVFLQLWALWCLKGWWKLTGFHFFPLFCYCVQNVLPSLVFFFCNFFQALNFNFQMLKSSGARARVLDFVEQVHAILNADESRNAQYWMFTYIWYAIFSTHFGSFFNFTWSILQL